MTTKLEAALAYASWGWHVLPVRANEKVPASEHGYKDATTDPERIKAWWSANPDYNVGIATGRVSNLTVFDVDPRNGGDEGWDEWIGEVGPAEGAMQLTAGGGQHYLAAYDPDISSGKLALGVDLLSDGRYFLVFPSVIDGREYQWEASSDPFEGVGPFVISEAWKEGYSKRRGKKSGQTQLPDQIPEGGRNDGLTSAGGHMRRVGFSESAIYVALSTTNRERCSPPLEENEVLGIAKSLAKYEPAFDGFDSAAQGQEAVRNLKAQARGADGNVAFQWPTPVDPFVEHLVPSFPLEVLPEFLKVFCLQQSQISGFDAGGYGFSLLVAAANTIDQRCKLRIGRDFQVPPMLWGALEGRSGSGKSPVMRRCLRPVMALEKERLGISRKALAAWKEEKRALAKGEEPPPMPPFKQRILQDTTVEAMAHVAGQNPEGLFLTIDEMTEFLGRMDAYTGRDGGKDRGVYLQAFDGGPVTINRVIKGTMVVDQLSVGILTGVQPEVLAAKLNKHSVASDGLYQRFLFYVLGDSGTADFTAPQDPYCDANLQRLFADLGGAQPITVHLADDAVAVFQDYTNKVRALASRTSARRFSEHLAKFPGFLGRVTLVLHLLHAGSHKEARVSSVGLDSLKRAMAVMGVLYRHSEAVYSVLDEVPGNTRDLAQSAIDAILSKGWGAFSIGDLTRSATHWTGKLDRREREAAIDLLIELGWIRDVTPLALGGRGRPSEGRFEVNPEVHISFKAKADQISKDRAARYTAITELAAARAKGPE